MSSFGPIISDLSGCKSIPNPRIQASNPWTGNFFFQHGHWLSNAGIRGKCELRTPSERGVRWRGVSAGDKALLSETKNHLRKFAWFQEPNGSEALHLGPLRLLRCDRPKLCLGNPSAQPNLQSRPFVSNHLPPRLAKKGTSCDAVITSKGWQPVKFLGRTKDPSSNFLERKKNLRAVADEHEALEKELEVELVTINIQDDEKDKKRVRLRSQILGSYATNTAIAIQDSLPPEGVVVLMSCVVGLVTGVCVVLFNLAVHEIHDIVWDGIPKTGATWLRTQTVESTWRQVVLVPVTGGIVTGLLNTVRMKLEGGRGEEESFWSNSKKFIRQLLKTGAAAVTLGTGCSLGPEGPSVEIGASIANGLTTVLRNSRERKLSLVAAGSAAGISSGFNAAVSGCFFAVESVLPGLSSGDAAPSLTTAMVLLSSVLASVVSQAGLGSDPTFRIPSYEFRSPTELPLYLLLGILSGGVSVAFTKGSSYATTMFKLLQRATGLPQGFLPPLGGLCVGVIALAYPEVLYWGFENVDVLLESTWPWIQGPSAVLLLQLVGAKLVATAICRGSGLVGGVYAPALFIGAALGSSYGSLASYASDHADPMWHLDVLDVAAPQAYALVGMAAVLAGVCQVPLTSVLLLFELTRDYRIILPLMAAVGLSSWVASTLQRKKSKNFIQIEPSVSEGTEFGDRKLFQTEDQILITDTNSKFPTASLPINGQPFGQTEICNLEDTLCLTTVEISEESLTDEISVRAAMRTKYAGMLGDTALRNAMSRMLAEKEWCVLIVNHDNHLEGLLTLADIQQEAEKARLSGLESELEKRSISAIYRSISPVGQMQLVTASPEMTLRTAQRLMAGRGLRQIPVVTHSPDVQGNHSGKVVLGLLDSECIKLACRTEATWRMLSFQGSVVVRRSRTDGLQ